MAGGHLLPGGWVVHILDAVAAQDQGPVGLGIGVVLGQNLLVDAHGLVVFVAATEVIGPVIEIGPPVIVQLGQGLLGAAAIAHSHGVAGVKFQRPTAHFAFEDCHFVSYSFIHLHFNLHGFITDSLNGGIVFAE